MYKIFDKNIKSCTINLRSTVSDFLNKINESTVNLNEDILFDLRVILNELLINAINHGNRGEKGKIVKVIAGLSKSNKLVLVVEDCGNGFDYEDICNNLKKITEDTEIVRDFSENGRGIMIVKNLCNGIRVNKKGNQIIVIKKLK